MSTHRPSRYISAAAMYILGATALLVLFLAALRLVLMLWHPDRIADIPADVLLNSFIIGGRFDFRVVAALMLPVVVAASLPWLDISRYKITRIITLTLTGLLGALLFIINLIDIEFFSFFNTRLNGSAMMWNDTPGDVLKMVWEWYPIIRWLIAWLCITALFVWLCYRLMHWATTRFQRTPGVVTLIWLPVVILPLVAGIYGRLFQVAPMRWGLAYHSKYDFANQLALNPAETLARDVFYDTGRREYMAALVDSLHQPDADSIARSLIGAPPSDNPAARLVRMRHFEVQNPHPPNIIFVLMESFASTKIGCLKSQYPYNLTPGFDSLAEHALLFTNFYSSGTHTCSGLFNSLTGSPHLFGKALMKQVSGYATFYALPDILRDRGYHTLFFTTQDPQFDNMQGFVRANGVEDVYSIFDYDSRQALSWMGVPDHIMFDFAYEKLSALADSGKPYMVTLLTGSNHGPWSIPDAPFEHVPDSVPRAAEFNAIKYADWAVHRFVEQLKHDPRFANTLIVLTADNGFIYNATTDLDLSILEIPMLMYNTSWGETGSMRNDRLGDQRDILPTILGQVGLDYPDYSLGKDLLHDTAGVDFVFTSRWHEVGFIEGDYYFIMRLNSGIETLFRLDDKTTDLIDSLPSVASEMKRKASAIFETAFVNYSRPILRHAPTMSSDTAIDHVATARH